MTIAVLITAGLTAWVAASVVVGVCCGRMIRVADEREVRR